MLCKWHLYPQVLAFLRLWSPQLCVCSAGAVQIWTVPTRLRPLAAGMGTVTSHLFGDVPTPPLTGWVQGECILQHTCLPNVFTRDMLVPASHCVVAG